MNLPSHHKIKLCFWLLSFDITLTQESLVICLKSYNSLFKLSKFLSATHYSVLNDHGRYPFPQAFDKNLAAAAIFDFNILFCKDAITENADGGASRGQESGRGE